MGVYWTRAILMDLRRRMFRHQAWHQYSLRFDSIHLFEFGPWLLFLEIIGGGGLAGAVRGCDRAPRFIRRSQSTAMMWWFAGNMVKWAHIERGGLISIISQFPHPSQILVVSRVSFHAINRMETIYLCSLVLLKPRRGLFWTREPKH